MDKLDKLDNDAIKVLESFVGGETPTNIARIHGLTTNYVNKIIRSNKFKAALSEMQELQKNQTIARITALVDPAIEAYKTQLLHKDNDLVLLERAARGVISLYLQATKSNDTNITVNNQVANIEKYTIELPDNNREIKSRLTDQDDL